ncbi:MAG: FtsX-like permease family protein [Weeksellaceae bacterium]|nr:FtsX-like permease family protein [Weeksellaceae bacterium]
MSRTIVRIGQAAVAIGIIVALITMSTGIGARKEIKQKLADFNGHITVTPYSSNLSLSSDTLTLPVEYYPNFPLPEIEHIQAIGTLSGIVRSEENFDGIVLKGVDANFDKARFEKFVKVGEIPNFGTGELNDDVIVSRHLANNFFLDIDSTFVTVFVDPQQLQNKPVYRNFRVKAIYETDIDNFDGLYIIGDLRHVQRINGWSPNQIGGFELFVKDIESDLQAVKADVNMIIGHNLIAQAATDHFLEIEEWISIFDKNIILILTIMMIVVIINMVMILLILILERTHSIGVLKTLGASNWQVQKIFIYYTLFIMIPGMIIGNAIALLLLWVQQRWGVIQLPADNYYITKAPVFLTWDMVLMVNLGMLVISAIILLIPTVLVRRILPTQALKMKNG